MNNTQLKKKFDKEFPNSRGIFANNDRYGMRRRAIIDFIHSALEEQRKEMEKEIRGMKQLPYYAQPAQNRNGMDYCATCEQAWEDCSCSARNTGYKKALQDVLDLLKKETK
jgi:Zn-dependent M32 family carboxypeptidase